MTAYELIRTIILPLAMTPHRREREVARARSYEGPERRDPIEQHHRRDDEELHINPKKVAMYVGLVLSCLSLVTIVAAFAGSKVATQQELDDATEVIADSLTNFKKEVRQRFSADSAETVRASRERALISPIAKLRCLEIAGGKSGVTWRDAATAGLPCDSLMPGLRQRSIDRQ